MRILTCQLVFLSLALNFDGQPEVAHSAIAATTPRTHAKENGDRDAERSSGRRISVAENASPAPQLSTDVERLSALFNELDVGAEQLAKSGRAKDAEELNAELKALREGSAVHLNSKRLVPFAVHVVHVREGGPLPADAAKDDDPAAGVAAVEVSDASAPTVLVLASPKKINWQVALADKAKIVAVVLDGHRGAETTGLPAGTLVIRSEQLGDLSSSRTTIADDANDPWRDIRSRGAALTGGDVLSVLGNDKYDGKPIHVGFANAAWRNQVLIHDALALRRKASHLLDGNTLTEELARIRFKAVHYIMFDGRWMSGGTAEFSPRGPIASTISHRSGKLTNYVPLTKDTDFALHGSRIVLTSENGKVLEQIPSDDSYPQLAQISSLALDDKRGRVIAAAAYGHSLFAYDREKESWSKLEDSGHPIAVVTYAAPTDCYYALSFPAIDDRGAARIAPSEAKLLRLTADGRLDAVICDAIPAEAWPGESTHLTQLVFADGRVMLLGACREQADGRCAAPIAVLDAMSGDVAYSGQMSPWSDKVSAPLPIAPTAFRNDTNDLQPITLIQRLARAQTAIENLRKSGETERAKRLASRLDQIRKLSSINEMFVELAVLNAPFVALDRYKSLEHLDFIRFVAINGSGNSWSEFSIRGPVDDALIESPEGVAQPLFHSPELNFGWRGRELVRFNRLNGSIEPIEIDSSLPGVGSPCVLTFDAQRKRLILFSRSVVSYSLSDREWTVLRYPNDTFDKGKILYSNATDTIWILDDGWEFSRFSPNRVRISNSTLKVPESLRRLGTGFQIADAGGFLAIIVPGQQDSRAGAFSPPQIFLFDPETSAYVYSGPLLAQPSPRPLTADELSADWKQLLTAENHDADRLMSRLAGAGDGFVKFLEGELKPEPMPPMELVEKLIRELDADEFKTREGAERQLSELGMAVREDLEKAAGHDSFEVSTRAKRLLAKLQSGLPSNARMRRTFRAVDILARIPTPASLQYLESLAGVPSTDPIVRKARESLLQLSNSEMAASANDQQR